MAQTELKDRTQDKIKVQKPRGYQVILWNDDFTPIDFVWNVLQYIFQKTLAEAETIASLAQKNGSSPVGTYSYDIASSLIEKSNSFSRKNGFPLTFTLQEE